MDLSEQVIKGTEQLTPAPHAEPLWCCPKQKAQILVLHKNGSSHPGWVEWAVGGVCALGYAIVRVRRSHRRKQVSPTPKPAYVIPFAQPTGLISRGQVSFPRLVKCVPAGSSDRPSLRVSASFMAHGLLCQMQPRESFSE